MLSALDGLGTNGRTDPIGELLAAAPSRNWRSKIASTLRSRSYTSATELTVRSMCCEVRSWNSMAAMILSARAERVETRRRLGVARRKLGLQPVQRAREPGLILLRRPARLTS